MDSTDPIISTATSTLINAGWPNQLLILGDYYLQYSLYVDSVANLEWYIIVLMPATRPGVSVLHPNYRHHGDRDCARGGQHGHHLRKLEVSHDAAHTARVHHHLTDRMCTALHHLSRVSGL